MALSATPIIPVNDPNSLVAAHADSKVYPPQSGTSTTANDVGAGEQILRNQTHTLNEVKVDIAGDTMTGLLTANAGVTVASGQTLTVDGATVAGAKTITGNTVFSGSSNTTISSGRKTFNRARVTLSDADQTVDVNDGDRFDLTVGPAAPRVITLDNTVVLPLGGETVTFFWYPKTTAVGGGTQYTFKRDDASTIAEFKGMVSADTGLVWAEFEYVSGVGWRLGKCSGTLYDAADASYYGVVGGASA